MRLGLSERVAIEAGIYRRDSLTKIAKDTGISRKSLSKEIRQNRTLAPAAKFNGKDCRFAAECTRQCVCGDFLCRQECVFCRKIDCRTLCPAYSPLSCMRIQSPPYVCNVCQLRRDCVCDRAYYVATQAHAVATASSRTRFLSSIFLYSASRSLKIFSIFSNKGSVFRFNNSLILLCAEIRHILLP